MAVDEMKSKYPAIAYGIVMNDGRLIVLGIGQGQNAPKYPRNAGEICFKALRNVDASSRMNKTERFG